MGVGTTLDSSKREQRLRASRTQNLQLVRRTKRCPVGHNDTPSGTRGKRSCMYNVRGALGML